jgi:Bardet-Biedl syndrome 4 protein
LFSLLLPLPSPRLSQDYVECLKVIEDQLRQCNGQSEYPLYIKALILRQQGRIEESLTTFQAALCLNPLNVNNLKQVGRSLFLIGKHKTALDVFDEAEKLSSEDREIWHNKGMCYLYLKQYENAIECFENANSIRRHEMTYIQLGRAYRLMGNEEDALRVYQDTLDLVPESSEILTTVGLLYLKMGNNTKAFEYLGNSLTYDPKNPKTILAAGSIIQDNQDMDVALVKYRIAATQTPNSPQLWNNVGMCFFGKGKYVAAVSCLKRAVYLAPFEWIISYNLGIVHLTVGQYASAFHYFSTAINLQPQYARAYMYLAVALSKFVNLHSPSHARANSLS